jgi:hypothetical protein
MLRELNEREMMKVEGGQFGLSIFAWIAMAISLSISGFLSLGLAL